ncbi:MAG TPA: hypothetical protein VMR70_05480 [Flavisolibacter sp.]|nr:hypothetical protein [Flavisolibacter sp.]
MTEALICAYLWALGPDPFCANHPFRDDMQLWKIEYQQAHYLSGIENLRGYRKDRFGGRSRAFNNTELRIRLFDFPTFFNDFSFSCAGEASFSASLLC